MTKSDEKTLTVPEAWVDEWFEHWPAIGRLVPESFRRPFGPQFDAIRLEEVRNDDEIVIRAELPGFDPDDIDVSVEGDMLTIEATREQREEETTEGGRRSEFRYGTFRRSARMPHGIDASDLRAEHDNGILEVHIPVAAGSEARRRIPVGSKESEGKGETKE